MYTLLVSYNAGISYEVDSKKEKLEDFRERTKELDDRFLRWIIVDENQEPVGILCKIYRNIFNTLTTKGKGDG